MPWSCSMSQWPVGPVTCSPQCRDTSSLEMTGASYWKLPTSGHSGCQWGGFVSRIHLQHLELLRLQGVEIMLWRSNSQGLGYCGGLKSHQPLLWDTLNYRDALLACFFPRHPLLSSLGLQKCSHPPAVQTGRKSPITFLRPPPSSPKVLLSLRV